MQAHLSSESKQQVTAVAANKTRHQPFFAPVMVQPKLAVGAVDDPFECEADETADRVLRMPVDSKAFFKPQTDSGKKLLAHELTHVVRQGNAKVRPLVLRDEVEKTMSDKWPEYIIRHIQRALRNHKLYTGDTTGKLDQQAVDGLNKVFYKDSWKNYDHKAVLGILTSKDAGWLIKNKPDEETLNKAKEIKMPDCDLAKGEFLLRIEEDLTRSKCILLSDPVMNKYIDTNLLDFNAQMLPDTNMFNINHNRIKSFRAISKDGTRVDFSPDELPKSKTRSGSSQVRFLFDYELKNTATVKATAPTVLKGLNRTLYVVQNDVWNDLPVE